MCLSHWQLCFSVDGPDAVQFPNARCTFYWPLWSPAVSRSLCRFGHVVCMRGPTVWKYFIIPLHLFKPSMKTRFYYYQHVPLCPMFVDLGYVNQLDRYASGSDYVLSVASNTRIHLNPAYTRKHFHPTWTLCVVGTNHSWYIKNLTKTRGLCFHIIIYKMLYSLGYLKLNSKRSFCITMSLAYCAWCMPKSCYLCETSWTLKMNITSTHFISSIKSQTSTQSYWL